MLRCKLAHVHCIRDCFLENVFSAHDFFFPGTDKGLCYLGPPGKLLKKRPAARVRQIVATESETVNRKMRRRIDSRWRTPTNPPVFETLSSLVLARNLVAGRRRISIEGKLVLSAAAGDRVWKAVLDRLDANAERRLNAEFQQRKQEAHHGMEVADPGDDDAPFVVDARNGFNFYHFLTETMPQLSVIARVRSQASIFIHLPRVDDLKDFVQGYVSDIYPGLAHRVSYIDKMVKYDAARLVYNHRHYLYQSSDAAIDIAFSELPQDDPWRRLGSDRACRKFLSKSTFDTGMRHLRHDALERVRGLPQQDRPKRLWIGRDPNSPDNKNRPNARENELLGELRRRDFTVAYLEKLTPLEQIAMINGADIVVGPHGAGFAHMLFANRRALFIEVGTPQTQLHRWGDFLGNAHVASCAYSTVFADVEGYGAAEDIPAISSGHRGIHIGELAAERILKHIDEFSARHWPVSSDAKERNRTRS